MEMAIYILHTVHVMHLLSLLPFLPLENFGLPVVAIIHCVTSHGFLLKIRA